MTRDHRGLLRGQFPFDDMEIGATDAAVRNADQNFAACGLRNGIVLEYQRVGLDMGRRMEDTGLHVNDTPHPLSRTKECAKH